MQVDSTDLDVIERRTIERVIRETNGNKVLASRKLGISRMQLYGRLRSTGSKHTPIGAATNRGRRIRTAEIAAGLLPRPSPDRASII